MLISFLLVNYNNKLTTIDKFNTRKAYRMKINQGNELSKHLTKNNFKTQN
jgi:hypothetical protein